MKIRLTTLSLLGVFLFSAGCSQQPVKKTPKADVIKDPTLVTIKKAVQEIKKEQALLAQVERSNKPLRKPLSIPPLPEFKTPLYMAEWTGPVDEALKNIAEIIGYEYRQSGNFGIMPIVHLDSRGQSIGKALIEIADQGEHGLFDIRLDAAARTLTLVSH